MKTDHYAGFNKIAKYFNTQLEKLALPVSASLKETIMVDRDHAYIFYTLEPKYAARPNTNLTLEFSYEFNKKFKTLANSGRVPVQTATKLGKILGFSPFRGSVQLCTYISEDDEIDALNTTFSLDGIISEISSMHIPKSQRDKKVAVGMPVANAIDWAFRIYTGRENPEFSMRNLA